MAGQNLLPIDEIAKTLPVDEIQGDVLVGLQKKAEIFVFFTIQDVAKFRIGLKNAIGHITFLRETAEYEIAKPGEAGKNLLVKANIAFSYPGIETLGLGAAVGVDTSFVAGAKASAASLGDKPDDDWLPEYRSETFHGVLLVAAWDKLPQHALTLARAEAESIKHIFGASILEAHREENKVRERVIGGKPQSGHEHFGFADGVSQPGVLGMTTPDPAHPDKGNPGQDLVKPGEFVIGLETADPAPGAPPVPAPVAPPEWMKNGSYMVVRRLRQDVTGFYSWAAQTAASVGKSEDQFTAGLVGRWRDGSPLVNNPIQPNPAEDEGNQKENNDFDFGPGDPAQKKCPFQAHIRKVYPRGDMADEESERHRILRAGIAFGEDEDHDKGLFFVCYQNSIVDKFEVLQGWANSADFAGPRDPAMHVPPRIGIDPIIGQGGEVRDGTWDTGQVSPPQPQQFVISTGAAYFFSPSKSALEAIGNG
uniref:Dyp-type peroxidase n=1 Tax=uncultured Sphingomonas sp. TaxID=158754 RepID=UPI0035CA09B5